LGKTIDFILKFIFILHVLVNYFLMGNFL